MDVTLLGFIDQRISDTAAVSWDTNKVGGSPCWMTEAVIDAPRCNVCSLLKTFVAQFYCPLSGSAFHRTLYIFVCPQCNRLRQKGSWSALRLQCTDENELKTTKNAAKQTLDTSSHVDEWGSDADDWDEDGRPTQVASEARTVADGDSSISPLHQDMTSSHDVGSSNISSSEMTEHLLTQLTIADQTSEHEEGSNFDEKHSSSTMKSETTARFSEPRAAKFDPYYIYVMEETVSRMDDSSDHVEKLLMRYKQQGQNFSDDVDATTSSSSSGEKYEKGNIHHGDHLFHKFTQKISNHPDQIVRYCFNGKALSAGPAVSESVIPVCRCGSRRVFELQLMPALVSLLKTPQQSGTVEFLTVHVYTCGRSCWTEGATLMEEFVIAEYDQDSSIVDSAFSRMCAADNSKLEGCS